MNLIITGGAGFVGSNLARAALERGHSLVVFDDLSRHGSAANLGWLRSLGAFTFIHGDIRAPHDVRRLIANVRPDVVFHLAGQVAMTTSLENPRRDFEVNAIGTFNVLEALREYSPNAAVLYSSTNKVYGHLEAVSPHEEGETRYFVPAYPNGFPEEMPFSPETPYGVSKGAADTLMQDAFRMFGQRTVVFRHSSIYGARQFATIDQGWLGWFCREALRQKRGDQEPFTVAGNGKQVRDLLHARDLVALYFAAIERIDDAAGKVFNIGGGIEASYSLLELFGYLEHALGTRLRYQHIAARVRDQKVFVADNTRAQRILAWHPSVTPAEGISEMLQWLGESESHVR